MNKGIEIILWIAVGIGMGPFFAIFATPIMVYLRIVFYVPFIREKLLEKAKADGHVVEAKLIKTYDETESDNDGGFHYTGAEVGVYTYECKGRMRKTRLRSQWGMPDTVPLYYIKNPRKAMPASQLGVCEQPWIKMYFLTWGVLAVVFSIIGIVTQWQFLYT